MLPAAEVRDASEYNPRVGQEKKQTRLHGPRTHGLLSDTCPWALGSENQRLCERPFFRTKRTRFFCSVGFL